MEYVVCRLRFLCTRTAVAIVVQGQQQQQPHPCRTRCNTGTVGSYDVETRAVTTHASALPCLALPSPLSWSNISCLTACITSNINSSTGTADTAVLIMDSPPIRNVSVFMKACTAFAWAGAGRRAFFFGNFAAMGPEEWFGQQLSYQKNKTGHGTETREQCRRW